MLFFLAACSTAPLVQEEDVSQFLEELPSENTVISDPIGYTYALSGEMIRPDVVNCPPWKWSFTGEKVLEGYIYTVNLHNVVSIEFFSKEKMNDQNIYTWKYTGPTWEELLSASFPILGYRGSDLSDDEWNCRYLFYLENPLDWEQFDLFCEYHPYLLKWEKNDPNNRIYPWKGILDYAIYYDLHHYHYINHLSYSIWHERDPDLLITAWYLNTLFPSSPQDMTPVADNCMIEIGDRATIKDLPFAIWESKATVVARIIERSDTSHCEDLKKEHWTVHFWTPHFWTKDLALFNHQVFCFVSVQDPVIEEITLL